MPDIVTKTKARDTHFTDRPDPRIPAVLRGWSISVEPAMLDVDLGEMRLRNVTLDLRGTFGDGARKDGSSITIFEVAGLCIVDLGHLHQVLDQLKLAQIGLVDVLMVPVDGACTMDQEAIAGMVRSLNPKLILPMHWFTPELLQTFLAQMPDCPVTFSPGAEIDVSRQSLTAEPHVVWLTPALFS